MSPRQPLVLLLTAALTVACGRSEEPATPPGERIASARERVTTPAPAEDVAATVASGTELALDLHRLLAADRENVFFSPQSIAFALSMAYPGAAGETATAFERTLRLTLGEAAHHRAMNDLARQLASRGEGAAGADGQPFRLRLVNQLFARQGLAFETPFLDLLAEEYGADGRLLDFAGAPEPSRLAINAWVARATEERIPELLGGGTIDRDTAAVLVNAVYFNAAWETPFPAAATAPRPFTLLDGSTLDVPMMHGDDVPAKAAPVDGGLDVVELPYDGGELSMLLLVPPAGGLADFEAQLTAARLAELVAALEPEHLSLSLPRFEVRTAAPLRGPLSDLGLGVAFTEFADFSRMTTEAALCVKDVVHEAFVKVNEAGTEAAAATAVIMGPTSAPTNRSVVIDRPFLFLVRDHATGAVVFLGRLARP
jgi:serpin B